MSTSSDAAAGLVLVERRARAAFVTLNRSDAANALSEALVGALELAFAELAADVKGGGDVRAVVLTGAGKAFCAGADLKERRAMTLEQTWAFLDVLNRLVNAVAAFPRPVVAAINGAAFGGGLELALACDIRIAADTAKFGQPELGLGIIPGAGATQRLPRIVGMGRAKYLILTGEIIDARQALEIGLVSALTPPGQLQVRARELAKKILRQGPLAARLAKVALNASARVDMDSGLLIETLAQALCYSSDDKLEGTSAFLEKRKPKFTGR